MEININKIYTDPANPGSYGGVKRFFNAVKKKNPKITINDIQDFLARNRTYTLFKPRRKKFLRSKFIPAGFMTDVQADLGDFQSLASTNNGYRYMLVAVDVLSRRVFAAPVKSKKTEDMKEAFDKVFKDMPYLPSRIFTDRGLEFESGRKEYDEAVKSKKPSMLEYFRENHIDKQRTRGGDKKAAVAERKIQEIKLKLYKYFNEKNTTDWVSVLP
ncbi:MAG TPA: transposase family protein, partial [Puia sp.]|nr:transposase family protein [Puia sp.]